MSDHRKHTLVWTQSVPRKRGTKKQKKDSFRIELCPASLWEDLWEPCSTLFVPKVPLRLDDRRDYWDSRYRIRVNGKLVGSTGRYQMFTKAEIRERYFR